MFPFTTTAFSTQSLPPSVPISTSTPAGPSSPPQTPDLSPQHTHQTTPTTRFVYADPSPSSSGRGLKFSRQPLASDVHILPVGSGHHFSYKPSPKDLPDLSPCSSSPYPPASSVEARDADDDVCVTGVGTGVGTGAAAQDALPSLHDGLVLMNDQDADDADDESCSGSQTRPPSENDDASIDLVFEAELKSRFVTISTMWVIEELSDMDPMESESNRLPVLRPYIIEDADSAQSESFTRGRHNQQYHHHHHHQELDGKMMRNLRKLEFSSSSSSSSDSDQFDSTDLAHQQFILKQREIRMRKRRSHSMASIGSKRTLSELSGDSDDLEDQAPVDFNLVGSSARRMRRKTDHWSIQFADPQPPRIEEQEEPVEEARVRVTNGGDHFWDRANLLLELPYCTMEVMEVDSS